MEVYLVRHGETNWNKEHRLQGQTDIPLNEFGRELAYQTEEGLSDIVFDVCISSDSCRAYETAKIILGDRNLEILTDFRLREMDLGEYEGRFFKGEKKNIPDSFQRFFDDPAHFVPGYGGETFFDVADRIADFMYDIENDSDLQNKTVLIATHGATLCGILNYVRGVQVSDYWTEKVHQNCAVSKINWNQSEWEIEFSNRAYYKEKLPQWGE